MTAKLSAEEEKAFVDRIRKLTQGKRGWFCPFCEARNEYRTSGLMYMLPGYKVDREKKTLVDLEGPAMPVVPMFCQHCGYINFFSAVVFSDTISDALGMK